MENIIEGHKIKIKHNELCDNDNNIWITNIDDKDYFYSEIEINVFSKAIKDGNNYFISCSGWIQVVDNRLIINPFPTDEDTILI